MMFLLVFCVRGYQIPIFNNFTPISKYFLEKAFVMPTQENRALVGDD